MKLERQQIVDTALLLLDEVGIDALTTRKLADRLGVQQPALYWHFKNKRALLDAMNAEMLHRHHAYNAPRPGDDWKSFLLGNAHSFRRALLSYRDGARVHAGTEAVIEDLQNSDAALRILVAAGFPVDTAMYTLTAIGRFVLGGVLDEQADQQNADDWAKQGLDAAASKMPLLSQALAAYRRDGHEAAFAAGMRLFIAGLEKELEALPQGRRRLGSSAEPSL